MSLYNVQNGKTYIKHRIATNTTDFDKKFTKHNKMTDNVIDLQTKKPLTTDLHTKIFDKIKYSFELNIEISKNDLKDICYRHNMQFSLAIAK